MSLAFNPLDIPNLGKSVANAILETDPTPIQSVARFTGAGVYAIYYTGDFPAYSAIGEANRDGKFELPIYVGKATPSGGRRGVTLTTSGTPLFSRLDDHRKSIEAATNLDAADFYVRWLVVESIWIPLGESVLIQHFAPVWNAVIDGFGNHDPGNGRYNGLNTKWDTLHPGRVWAPRLRPRIDTTATISQEAIEYIRSRSE
ncbi:Eco29kI family restriction endonuclease [Microbacterium sp. K5D]|uniref:Eco29kI family restriction endonuclease n=1 Tax=Microbacterium sp. K5D TaxID=2305436 RepID=UPI00109C282A|nr:Eco29kI family restriction endonuclease [Microbacterium sp. K5D]